MLKKSWVLKAKPNIDVVNLLQQELNVHESICELLAQRGINSLEKAKKFFRPSHAQIHNPMTMKNMAEAVQRIKNAINKKEKILIYGDYDVDGTTAVAMVFSFFKDFYDNLIYYVPNRYSEGYGISVKSIDFAKNENVKLVIALDCGIKAVSKVAYAKSKEIDYIICDHHLPGEVLPNGIILNPKQVGCGYPFKELSGAGVGFKLLQAYCTESKIEIEKPNLYLDLLAISIGADMVPIVDENRVLAKYGMEKLNSSPNLGVKAILNNAKIERMVNMRDIGFSIGPRINAAGRISDASKAVELLITSCESSAKNGSEEVSLYNFDRKILDEKTTKEALSVLLSSVRHQDKKSTFVYQDNWNKGVLGIVCNRIQESYYRPTIVLTRNGSEYTGSARSVKGYNIYDAINSCSDILESFGGHAFAAGLTVNHKNIEKFSERFEKVVSETIEEKYLIPTIEVDLEVPINKIKNGFFKLLNQFEPFGIGNEQPIFTCKKVKALRQSVRVVGRNHLKMDIIEENKPEIKIPSIAFNQIHNLEHISKGNSFDICYSLEINEWKGKKTLQAIVKDIQF
jgi:single-stranded-DNA-specific exonuclease